MNHPQKMAKGKEREGIPKGQFKFQNYLANDYFGTRKKHVPPKISTEEFAIPAECAGAVIGARGAHVREIQQATGAKLHFQRPPGADKDCEIIMARVKGADEQRTKAKKWIMNIVDTFEVEENERAKEMSRFTDRSVSTRSSSARESNKIVTCVKNQNPDLQPSTSSSEDRAFNFFNGNGSTSNSSQSKESDTHGSFLCSVPVMELKSIKQQQNKSRFNQTHKNLADPMIRGLASSPPCKLPKSNSPPPAFGLWRDMSRLSVSSVGRRRHSVSSIPENYVLEGDEISFSRQRSFSVDAGAAPGPVGLDKQRSLSTFATTAIFLHDDRFATVRDAPLLPTPPRMSSGSLYTLVTDDIQRQALQMFMTPKTGSTPHVFHDCFDADSDLSTPKSLSDFLKPLRTASDRTGRHADQDEPDQEPSTTRFHQSESSPTYTNPPSSPDATPASICTAPPDVIHDSQSITMDDVFDWTSGRKQNSKMLDGSSTRRFLQERKRFQKASIKYSWKIDVASWKNESFRPWDPEARPKCDLSLPIKSYADGTYGPGYFEHSVTMKSLRQYQNFLSRMPSTMSMC